MNGRIFTILFVLISLPLWVILFLFVICGQLVHGFPIFYSQERIGQGNSRFTLIKFRTLNKQGRPASGWHRFLRRTHLDELPQWLHLISGSMNLIGPRPLPGRYLERMSKRQRYRHHVRPGLTGLAQVYEHPNITWQERFSLDLRYVYHHSLSMDLSILLQTMMQIFCASGKTNDEQMPEFKGSSVNR